MHIFIFLFIMNEKIYFRSVCDIQVPCILRDFSAIIYYNNTYKLHTVVLTRMIADEENHTQYLQQEIIKNISITDKGVKSVDTCF